MFLPAAQDAREDARLMSPGTWSTVPVRWRALRAPLVCLVGASAFVGWAVDRGAAIRVNPDVKLQAAPLVGQWDWAPTWRIVPALMIAIGVIVWTGRGRKERPSGVILFTVGLLASAWTVALAWSQGTAVMIDPVTHPTEYWAQLPKLPPAGRMLHVWSDPLWMRNQPVHLKGHPPGYVLLLKVLGHLGLNSPWAVATLSWVAAGSAAVAVTMCVHIVAPGRSWRVVAPFAVLAPYAVWMGTSADAVFAGVGAGSVVAVLAALRATSMRRSAVWSTVSGLGLGASLFLSYGTVTFGLVPAAIILALPGVAWRRRMSVGLLAGAGVVAVVSAFAWSGFWWFDGLETTRLFYWKGSAKFRPWGYFFVANLAVIAIASGPAVVAALGHQRRNATPASRVWLMPAAAAVAMLVADVSQLSKGETERIWLPFFVFLVPLVTGFGDDMRRRRLWLCFQAATALVLQTALLSKW